MAIVGAGWAGRRQAEAVRELGGDFTVAALVDRDEAHLNTVAGELGVATCHTDYRRVLEDSAVDAVSICTPHALHARISFDAAAAGNGARISGNLNVGYASSVTKHAGSVCYFGLSECHSPLRESTSFAKSRLH